MTTLAEIEQAMRPRAIVREPIQASSAVQSEPVAVAEQQRGRVGDQPIADENRVMWLRREATKKDDPRAPRRIGGMTAAIREAVERREWPTVAQLLEHTLGRLEMGEWQASAWVPCPGTMFYQPPQIGCPGPIRERLDYLREFVTRARAEEAHPTSIRAIAAGIHLYDDHADERARMLVAECGL